MRYYFKGNNKVGNLLIIRLTQLGGRNARELTGTRETDYYYIDEFGVISRTGDSVVKNFLECNFTQVSISKAVDANKIRLREFADNFGNIKCSNCLLVEDCKSFVDFLRDKDISQITICDIINNKY